jgi:hypothetical protein
LAVVVNTCKVQLFERQVAKFFDCLLDIELAIFDLF